MCLIVWVTPLSLINTTTLKIAKANECGVKEGGWGDMNLSATPFLRWLRSLQTLTSVIAPVEISMEINVSLSRVTFSDLNDVKATSKSSRRNLQSSNDV